MLDSTLRPVKDRLLAPVASGPVGRVPVAAITLLGLACTLAGAAAAWRGMVVSSVVLWLLGRLFDGLDGAVARSSGQQSDAGGLFDFVADSIGYAAIPLGIAAGVDDRATWIATAVVLATFYVNAVSLGQVAALIEKRAVVERGVTSVVMPRGLVEGTETIVVFTLALAFPDSAAIIWWVFAAAVAVTIAERLRWASRGFAPSTGHQASA